ncbi:ABC transporter ATP-binding protein [Robertmurraya korlensis]|uniref:ABC transporter ATP-binding protein n=1 Tax=Robertmurraya korlensis TaxID=519977 RepID=UPI0020405ED7|nr:ABC transporter ATP-binding protein [Robertmurraya korlensis]
MELLELQNVSFSYRDKQILNDLNLFIKNGEFVTILGPSGSGKSTIFQLIGGLQSPHTGSIILEGNDITGNRGHISYMPQTPSLLPWRTIIQNVVLGQELKAKKNYKTADEMLQKAGLMEYRNAFPHELSGGMKQRVAFSRALLSPQPIICLDEPFSALDELTRHEMQLWLLSIWEQYKKTIIFVTHNIEESLFLSDRILVLSDKPARIKQEVIVPFSRPRNEELMFSEEFLRHKKMIHDFLKEKVGQE